MSQSQIDVPLVSLREAERLSNGVRPWSRPWRLRLVFVGANADNVSGESRKYWQITAPGAGSYDTEIRWGRLGSRGQSQGAFARDALARAEAKIRKGYTVDTDTVERARAETIRAEERVVAARPARAALPLASRVSAISWRVLPSDDALIDAAASLGWVALELDDVPVGHRLFVGKGGSIWGVRLSPLAFGELPVGGGA